MVATQVSKMINAAFIKFSPNPYLKIAAQLCDYTDGLGPYNTPIPVLYGKSFRIIPLYLRLLIAFVRCSLAICFQYLFLDEGSLRPIRK